MRDLVEDDRALGRPVTLVNSVNPYRIAGQKTAAFEVCEDLGGAPDYLAIPVGNAGNITAYWQGFTDYLDAGLVETRRRRRRLHRLIALPRRARARWWSASPSGQGIPEVKVNRLLLGNLDVRGVGWGGYAMMRPSYMHEQWRALPR